jgi:hypothetical protein
MSDTSLLRQLARRVRGIADQPEMAVLRRRWLDHNSLKRGQPLILAYPEGAWPELVPEGSLECQDKTFRGWERQLRRRICWWEHIRDDQFIEPFFGVGWSVDLGNYGFEIPYIYGDNRGSYVWDPPMKDLERDIGKLRPRNLRLDRESTQKTLDLANNTFGDILPARIRGSLWWTLGLTWDAVLLVGLEQLMLAMYDQPQALHQLMAFLRDDRLRLIEWAQAQGILSPNNGPDYVGSGGVGTTQELAPPLSGGDPVHLSDLWGFAESQETVGVSPQMFGEFVLPYQVPLLEKFGLNYYGCCEQLEHRIDLVLRHVPRLRRVSVAPQANQRVLAEKLGPKYIFTRKANPVPVCVEFSEPAVRRDLRATLDLPIQGPLEIILKDTHTVQNEPWRIGRWVEIAREEVARNSL